jgi:hypothetical protein
MVMKTSRPSFHRAAGFEDGAAGLVGKKFEGFGDLLVLHDAVVDAEVFGLAVVCAGADRHHLVGAGDPGNALAGDFDAFEGDFADPPAAEPCLGHQFPCGHAVFGDRAELVPRRQAGGGERGLSIREGFQFVCHEWCCLSLVLWWSGVREANARTPITLPTFDGASSDVLLVMQEKFV